MRNLKSLGLVAALALFATGAAVAAEPQSLQQLDRAVAQTHPVNDPITAQAFANARERAGQAYAAGDTATGRQYENFARSLVGLNPEAPAINAVASAR